MKRGVGGSVHFIPGVGLNDFEVTMIEEDVQWIPILEILCQFL